LSSRHPREVIEIIAQRFRWPENCQTVRHVSVQTWNSGFVALNTLKNVFEEVGDEAG